MWWYHGLILWASSQQLCHQQPTYSPSVPVRGRWSLFINESHREDGWWRKHHHCARRGLRVPRLKKMSCESYREAWYVSARDIPRHPKVWMIWHIKSKMNQPALQRGQLGSIGIYIWVVWRKHGGLGCSIRLSTRMAFRNNDTYGGCVKLAFWLINIPNLVPSN